MLLQDDGSTDSSSFDSNAEGDQTSNKEDASSEAFASPATFDISSSSSDTSGSADKVAQVSFLTHAFFPV